ncbi:MAG TPA: hypothetical protein VNS88_16280, partial [Nitrospiraceae bacterium]|nr:hypothetical protein [Nitrospiraceae bacterium]
STPASFIRITGAGDNRTDQFGSMQGSAKLRLTKATLDQDGGNEERLGTARSGNRSKASWKLAPLRRRTYKDIEFKLRVFLPPPILNVGPPVDANPFHGGDDRGFSYNEGTHRAQQRVVVSLDPENKVPVIEGPECEFGETTTYFNPLARHAPGKPDWWYEPATGFPGTVVHRSRVRRTAKNNNVEVDWQTWVPHPAVKVTCRGSASVPSASAVVATLAPAIDWDIGIFLRLDWEKQKFVFEGNAQHDGFPAYELYLNRKLIYEFDPVLAGTSPYDLGAPYVPGARVINKTFAGELWAA